MNPPTSSRQQQEKYAQSRYSNRTDIRKDKEKSLAAGDWELVDDPSRVVFRAEAMGASQALERHRVDPAFNILERIIGENELQPASFIFLAASKLRTVGRITINGNQGFGTGFLVSPRLILTNNHVLSSITTAQNSFIQFDYLEDSDQQIKSSSTFRFTPSDFFVSDPSLDFTLVAIEPTNHNGEVAAHRGWNPLIPQSGKALFNERVNILQHPAGRPLELSLQDNRVVDIFDSFMHYTTDTDRGSSGSPVYNNQWQVAALHHAGVPKRDQYDNIIGWVANEGVRISSIMEYLDRDSPSWESDWQQVFKGVLQPSPITFPPPINQQSSQYETDPISNTQTPQANITNGVATWTIPLKLSMAIGNNHSDIKKTVSVPDDTPSNPNPKIILPQASLPSSPLKERAIALVENFSSKPYYNKPKDEKDANEYYKSLDMRFGKKKMFQALHELLTGTHTNIISYRKAKNEFLYPWVDLHEIDDRRELRSIYSGKKFSAEEILEKDFQIEHEIIGRSYLELDEFEINEALEVRESSRPYNCEHVVCQSWFDKSEPMRGDMHHLFACESRCNSFRSNHPYFEFPEEKFRHDCGRIDVSNPLNRKFEPVRGKGTVARATLYFLLRYPELIGDRPSEFQRIRLPLLLSWHEVEPPNIYEFHRNAAIHEFQGNRNPLIDFPYLSKKIDWDLGFGS